MRASLQRWITDNDTLHSLRDFNLGSNLAQLDYLGSRAVDLYFSLVGEVFDYARQDLIEPAEWSALGNALAAVSRDLEGPTRSDALFFSAVSFYCGGYSASSSLSMREANPQHWDGDAYRACYDLLARSSTPVSEAAAQLLGAVQAGDLEQIAQLVLAARDEANAALQVGPEEWVSRHLYANLVDQFQHVNIRSVLPDGASARWQPLVTSFLSRKPPMLEFFPSQIEAINAGLLVSTDTYSLQMPTGAGKTALTETLLFSHLSADSSAKAALIVPYRALARELRYSLGRHLTSMGLPTRTIYGGTVPSREEIDEIEDVRVVIATPESLTGLLGTHPEVAQELSLVICDEGHLLDDGSRGIGLELLLARLRARAGGPRMVFLSAIVPNIDEINSWLGGQGQTVVRSDFRPATAEYAVMRPSGSGRRMTVGLELQELSTSLPAHTLPGFLELSDFQYVRRETGRSNTFGFGSTKTQAVAAARKALALGTVAVFATTKTGSQGVIGLAEELISQVDAGLALPLPNDWVRHASTVAEVIDYLVDEFGADWVGVRALGVGAVVHHGDLPQATREVLEELLTTRAVPMVFCTSTLAEGVNLPIRTMVLYSVRRGSESEGPVPMLARDIKNLVGRAGRAGSSTRGLVICANPNQWSDVRPVAAGRPGERVEGALLNLLQQLQQALANANIQLTNSVLESNVPLFSLVDGIDSTLIELVYDELGADSFLEIANSVARATFAAHQSGDNQSGLLSQVFALRASRILELRSSGRLSWIQDTGARPRLLNSVVQDLYPSRQDWASIDSPVDEGLLDAVIRWALAQKGFDRDLAEAYRKLPIPDAAGLRMLIASWLQGESYARMAEISGLDVNELLRVHTQVVMDAFSTLVEQGIALLSRVAAADGVQLSDAVTGLPLYLRYGVSSPVARDLMASGVRHRRAANVLAPRIVMQSLSDLMLGERGIARTLLHDERDELESELGRVVYRQTVQDLAAET